MELKAPAVVFVICVGGLFCLGRAVLDPGLEWRLLAMAALVFLISPFSVEVRWRAGHESIPLPLTHSTLFAGAIALGPVGAALPAAFCGVARVLFGPEHHKPLPLVLHVILKPSVVCAVSAFAYSWMGGSALRPQAVESFVPLLCAGLVYVAASAALGATASGEWRVEGGEQGREKPRWMSVVAGWSMCLLAGYMLAVLYAVAPTYVLIAPTVAVGLAWRALRQGSEEAVQTAESLDAEDKETGDSCTFVDSRTGLANARYLEMFLQREISRAERGGAPLSLAVFDLDDAGKRPRNTDAVAAMGQQLKSVVREYDLVAMSESGRVVVALPEAGAEEAFEIAERLHESVTSVAINGKPISASVGIATLPSHAATSEELINAAHRALNQGRFAGPNGVHGLHRLRKAG